MLRVSAPAKINLFLHVVGRRSDGFHELDSLVVFSEFGDVLNLQSRVEKDKFEVSGPFAAALHGGGGNIVQRAIHVMRSYSKNTQGLQVDLEKYIPVAAGLGGGSCDAAALMRALCKLWVLDVPDSQLEKLALSLGADVPACLRAVPVAMKGVGEILEPAPALSPRLPIVLAHTGEALATPLVFAELMKMEWSGSRVSTFSGGRSIEELAHALANTRNDLEPAARRLQPCIGKLIDAIKVQKGCYLARMSGSGAACFGLFATNVDAQQAQEKLKKQGWWAEATMLLEDTA